MTAVFGIIGAVTLFWAALTNFRINQALAESYPPQFQEGLTSKFVLHVIALSPSTPLPLQADYVKSLAAGCIAMFCFSLSLFSADKITGGWLSLGSCLLIAFSTVKSWKSYKANCNRAATHSDKEQS